MGRDAFAQIRKTDGSVPAAAVQPIYAEGGPGDSFHMRGLRFSPVAPTEAGRDGSPFVEATARGRAAMTLVDLSACTTVRGRLPSQWGEEAPADAGYQLRVSVERLVEFALEHGPLCARFPYARSLDGGELVEGEEFEESMGFWASAAIMADLAVAAQRCANGSLPLAAAQAALGNLVLWRVDNPRTGSSFDLFVISRTLDGAYTSWLGVPRFIRREEVEGRINYAFILGDADLDGVVEVALASFEHEITASDYRLLSQALDLAPSVDREVREVLSLEAAEVYSGVESDGYRLDDEKLRGCAGKLEKADLPQMASMVRALVTAHLGDAYVDVFSVSGATGHFSFRSYLSWLWYDFSCDLGAVRIKYCARCGRPFSVVVHRGPEKNYCSAVCRDAAHNERMATRRDGLRHGFLDEGKTVEELAREFYPNETSHEATRRTIAFLQGWPELKHAVEDDIEEHGWHAPLFVRCHAEGIDVLKLLNAKRHKQLKERGGR